MLAATYGAECLSMSDRTPLPYDFRDVRGRLQRELHRLLPVLFGVGVRIPSQGVFAPR